MNLFIIKAADHAVPADAQMVAQFACVHKKAGSPPLRLGGVAPTGPLPAQINFPRDPRPRGRGFRLPGVRRHAALFQPRCRPCPRHRWQMLASSGLSETERPLCAGDVTGGDRGPMTASRASWR